MGLTVPSSCEEENYRERESGSVPGSVNWKRPKNSAQRAWREFSHLAEDDSQQFSVPHVIISLGRGEAGVKPLVHRRPLRQYGSHPSVRSIDLHYVFGFQVCMGEDRFCGEPLF